MYSSVNWNYENIRKQCGTGVKLLLRHEDQRNYNQEFDIKKRFHCQNMLTFPSRKDLGCSVWNFKMN